MEKAKSYFTCWMGADEDQDEINRLKTELEDTKHKLNDSRNEVRRLRLENARLSKHVISFPPTPQDSDRSNASNHGGLVIPNFDYTDATIVIHDGTKQGSALEKLEEKVKEKWAKSAQYEILSDSEQYDDNNNMNNLDASDSDNNDIYISPKQIKEIELRHKAEVNELMKQIDKLSIVIQEAERDKNEMMQLSIEYVQIINNKEEEIKSLKKQIKELKLKEKKRNSFSFSINRDIMENDSISQNKNNQYDDDKLDDDDDQKQQKDRIKKPKINIKATNIKTSGKRGLSPKSPSFASRKHHYDNTKEQIEILNNEKLKNKSLSLCREQEKIHKNGRDKGIIVFFEKYVKKKIVDQIFSKSGMVQKSDPDCISNASGLVNVLSFATILYKVKVFQVENAESAQNKRPKIDNVELKNTVKYLAIWIVRTYGDKTNEMYFDNDNDKEYNIYNFKLTKQDFGNNMVQYLQHFVQCQGKHNDSQL